MLPGKTVSEGITQLQCKERAFVLILILFWFDSMRVGVLIVTRSKLALPSLLLLCLGTLLCIISSLPSLAVSFSHVLIYMPHRSSSVALLVPVCMCVCVFLGSLRSRFVHMLLPLSVPPCGVSP